MIIADLPQSVIATKSDWLAGTTWMGFTPGSDSLDSRNRTASTVQRQFRGGYVLEYITQHFPKPNSGFETQARYLEERERHSQMAGRLVAIHKLQYSALPLQIIVGKAENDLLQNMWSKPGARRRWSVAFPIIETYEIEGWPSAKSVFGQDAYQRLYAHQSATLQPLLPSEQASLAELPLRPMTAPNSWIRADIEIQAALKSSINPRIEAAIDRDFSGVALEGETIERTAQYRRRAAWLAAKFVQQRRTANSIRCDACPFDPSTLEYEQVNPRSLLDVHHKRPIAEGLRESKITDFALLCPTCHRLEHLLMKQERTLLATPRATGPSPSTAAAV